MTSPTAGRSTVTQHFSILEPVPFVDVDVLTDNPLFVDPTSIRLGTDPWSRRADAQLDSCFGEIVRCRRSTATTDHTRGLALLGELHEPNETRLGLSRGAPAGHAVGPVIGEDLWDELARTPAFAAAVLTRLEDLRVYVDGVGSDVISDITTRIVFDVLADFTTDQMALYPSLAVGATTETVKVWDAASTSWVAKDVTLPYVGPHQLLLVPRGWVHWRAHLDPYVFYNRFATRTVQLERTTRDAKGRALAPSKAALKREFPHVRALNNQQAAKNAAEGIDLTSRYRRYVQEGYAPLSDEQLSARLGTS